MAFKFILPDIGEGVVDGEVVRWHVKAGDVVTEDQTLVEVMTDKATVSIPSPKAGTISKLHYKEGEVAKVGQVLIEIDTDGGSAAANDEAPRAPVAAKPEAPRAETMARAPEAARVAQSAPAPRTQGNAAMASAPVAEDRAEAMTSLTSSTGDREVLATPMVRKLAREEGVDLASIAGSGANGRITREDVLHAAQGGQVLSFQPPARPAVSAPTQQNLLREQQPREQQPREQQPRDLRDQPSPRDYQPAQQQQSRDPQRDQRDQQRDQSREQQRQPQQQQQRDQRDQQREQPREQQRPAQAPAPIAAQSPARGAGDTRVPIRGLRKRISERMRLSKNTAAHFTYVEELDLTDLVALRDRLKAKYEPQGIKLNYLPFIMKACVLGLKKFPNINAVMDDNANELVVKSEFNMGFAVQTDEGLMVPVVKDVNSKSIVQLAKEIDILAEKCRKRQASTAELTGGSFTITSLGQLGGVLATPVINYPEVAILGVHAIKAKPAVIDNQIVIRQLANFASSFDHRIIDGYIGAQFIAEVKKYLEAPEQLFMELA